jgi:hypothetical protein
MRTFRWTLDQGSGPDVKLSPLQSDAGEERFAIMKNFVVAATIAVNTLSSPVGPIIATTLTGLGALAGARLHTR